MKAVKIYHYGGPEELKYEEDAQMPELKPDDVLVRVFATGVNPVDWKTREGNHGKDSNFPKILGWDFSGVIEKVGPNAGGWKVGDEVYGRPDLSRDGTYAEYAAVKAGEIAHKPKTIEHNVAGGVALAGLTAWQGLFDLGRLQAGERVLIHAAAGGVGSFAVQFAKWKGAYVIGTASGKNVQFLEELGADEVIDHDKEDFSASLREIDLVFDTLGGKIQEASLRVLKPAGRLVTTVGLVDATRERGRAFMAESKPEELGMIAELIDSGKVIPVVSKIFPLKEAAEAQRVSEEGHTRGKIILEVC